MKKWLFWLEISRPGLWFQTLWLYLLPLARRDFDWNAPFWVGALYVLFPLNFLVYGWNDLVDADIDRLNPRKGNFLFGARANAAQLKALPRALFWVSLPCFLILVASSDWKTALLLAALVGVLWIYNAPRKGWRGRPPLELLNQIGYLLLIPLSMNLNGVANLPLLSWVYLWLFCTHAHLMGEVMDVIPDRAAHRRTTATILGAVKTKWLVLALVLVEAAMICGFFRDWILGGFLLFGVLWLRFDIFWWGERAYSKTEFTLFGLGLNAAGFASMVWVAWTGTLTKLP